MDNDPVRPTDEAFDRFLCESYTLWASYASKDEAASLPIEFIGPKNILGQAPAYLGDGIVSKDDPTQFDCIEEYGVLYVKCHSVWKTSDGDCRLEPKELPVKLLLALPGVSKAELSEAAAFSEWPKVQGLENYDKGNYIAILFSAWAYIFNVRWVELLRRDPQHECSIEAVSQEASQQHLQNGIEIDVGSDASMEEVYWWNTIWSSSQKCSMTTTYKGTTYFSPWAVTIAGAKGVRTDHALSSESACLPSSDKAVEYLARFCSRKSLYGQCLAALAAVLLIPGNRISLPIPKEHDIPERHVESKLNQSTLLQDHYMHLSRYMMLSCDVWGIRSLLHGTFFDPRVACNLVTAWKSAAFAVLSPVMRDKNYRELLAILGRRQPNIAPLWLGAIIVDNAQSLTDIRSGLGALRLHSGAWTGTTQCFITLRPGDSDDKTIKREDECRLLFISGDEISYPSLIWPWKPFGETYLCDTELTVQEHAQCGCHCFEYSAWCWALANGAELRVSAGDTSEPCHNLIKTEYLSEAQISDSCFIEHLSDELSANTTRGVFTWLRQTGFPANEREIYTHPWFDTGESDEEASSDSESRIGDEARRQDVEKWLIDQCMYIDVGRR
ncbi:hypothetical protein BDV25DRAFT_141946 [Aspergillus avenaceus]|uniref:Uncharacterized protein n=1 Tax=Aspergillus avenaceus TaxID=36643 RepID=A0A5N6TPN0_ASPAV|nr:hypothetical protein BDV25DRAFT_141946 [Aspergillus avenaceus]